MVIYGKYMESPNSVHGEQGGKAGKQGGSGESGGHSFLVRKVFQSTQFLEWVFDVVQKMVVDEFRDFY